MLDHQATDVGLGMYVVPVACVRPGYRVMPLYGQIDNMMLPLTRLFVKIEIGKS